MSLLGSFSARESVPYRDVGEWNGACRSIPRRAIWRKTSEVSPEE